MTKSPASQLIEAVTQGKSPRQVLREDEETDIGYFKEACSNYGKQVAKLTDIFKSHAAKLKSTKLARQADAVHKALEAAQQAMEHSR